METIPKSIVPETEQPVFVPAQEWDSVHRPIHVLRAMQSMETLTQGVPRLPVRLRAHRQERVPVSFPVDLTLCLQPFSRVLLCGMTTITAPRFAITPLSVLPQQQNRQLLRVVLLLPHINNLHPQHKTDLHFSIISSLPAAATALPPTEAATVAVWAEVVRAEVAAVAEAVINRFNNIDS